MGLSLLFPATLTALLALLVPLAIHIARKSEQLPTDFAALRWLRSKPRPRSRLRFDEWPLLLLRLLLLALLALWLAQPVLSGAGDDTPYVAVVPGAQMDRTQFTDARVHWLAPGFPSIEEPAPTGPFPVASLIRQIDADLPAGTPLTILTPQVIDGADAARLHLSRKVDWSIEPGTMPSPTTAPSPAPTVAIRYDAAHRPALRYLRAAATNWQPTERPLDSAPLDSPLPDRQHVLIWLAGGTLPDNVIAWITKGGTALIASDATPPNDTPTPHWREALGIPLVEGAPLGAGRWLRFTRPLRPADMPVLLDGDFPAQLRRLLAPSLSPPTRVAAADYAPLPGGRAYDQQPEPLRPWLALLIALLLIAERWLATRRSRGVSP
ncbi:BatA domain-containing protein [Sphingobium sp. MK2]|uniref:BatA domain-containing protein n=1 Tax=Sphingobium sp. MK2 TaxID=3116540 RepID=UPI0032E35944